jgi:hypothetical protein
VTARRELASSPLSAPAAHGEHTCACAPRPHTLLLASVACRRAGRRGARRTTRPERTRRTRRCPRPSTSPPGTRCTCQPTRHEPTSALSLPTPHDMHSGVASKALREPGAHSSHADARGARHAHIGRARPRRLACWSPRRRARPPKALDTHVLARAEALKLPAAHASHRAALAAPLKEPLGRDAHTLADAPLVPLQAQPASHGSAVRRVRCAEAARLAGGAAPAAQPSPPPPTPQRPPGYAMGVGWGWRLAGGWECALGCLWWLRRWCCSGACLVDGKGREAPPHRKASEANSRDGPPGVVDGSLLATRQTKSAPRSSPCESSFSSRRSSRRPASGSSRSTSIQQRRAWERHLAPRSWPRAPPTPW